MHYGFQDSQNMQGFGMKSLVTIMDQEKPVDCCFEKAMRTTKQFLKPLPI